MLDELWGEVRSACAAGLWSDAIQAIDVAASSTFDSYTWERAPPAITGEQAAELLRYCARAASLADELDAVADLSVAVLCESGLSWPQPLPDALFWDDHGGDDLEIGPYTLRVYPAADLWCWSVRVEGVRDVDFGSEPTQGEARAAALRAARVAVIALVRQLF